MPLPHIDDRLARLAEAATRAAGRPGVRRRAHARRLDRSGTPEGADADAPFLELAGAAIEALASGDVEAIRDLCTDCGHVRTPTTDTPGVDDLARWVGAQAHPFTDLDLTIDWLVVGGLGIAAEWRLRTTHCDALRIGRVVIEPNGASIVVDGAFFGHVDATSLDGERLRLDDIHIHYDTAEVLMQLSPI